MTATFHLFPHLPFELRTRIWELTVEPRIVEVRVLRHDPNLAYGLNPAGLLANREERKHPPPVRHLRSPTPAPAQLHTCREAREHLSEHPYDGYQKAFSSLVMNSCDGFNPVPEGDPERERYVWLNFNLDMVSVGTTDVVDHLHAIAWQIKRLRIERSIWSEYFCRTELPLIGKMFNNLTELHVICLEGMKSAYQLIDDDYFSCGPENVYWIDTEVLGGKMMSSVELDALIDKENDEFDELEGDG